MNKKNVSEYRRLNVFDGTEILFAQGHTIDFPLHTHDTFNIALILDQTFSSRLTTNFVQAPVGSICITNPDEIHATPCEKKLGNSFITFYIAPTILRQLNHGADVFFKDKVIYDQRLFSTLFYLSQNIDNRAIDYETELMSALSELVKQFATEIHFQHKELILFREFVQDDLSGRFSLEQTARKFGVNKYKLLRLFKHETGLTPNSFITLKRIEQAKRMLAEHGDLPEIAFCTGFYDLSHFNREFKRYVGVTPGTYRNA